MTKTGKRVLLAFLIIGAVFALGIIILASMFFANFSSADIEHRPQVGRIYLRGNVQEAGDVWGTEAITPSLVASRLEEARQKNLDAVVLRIQTPGGSVAASQEIYSLLEEYNRPVVVSMGDMCASGGYYISAPADAVIAHPGTMTGSVGVISQAINIEGLLDKLGIEMQTITSGEHKDMLSREMTREEIRKMQALSDNIYEQFISDVARGRDMEIEQIRELATGELFTGEQAQELGLVDQLGGMDEALAIAAEKAGVVDPVYYDFPEPGFFEMLWSLSVRLPRQLFRTALSPELLILERFEEGSSSVFEYKVPGY